MSRIHLSSLTIVLGLFLAYSGIVSAAPDVKNAFSGFMETGIEGVNLPAAADHGNTAYQFWAREQDLASNQAQPPGREVLAADEGVTQKDLLRSLLLDEMEAERADGVTEEVEPEIPVRLIIPKIELEAPVVPVEITWVEEKEGSFQQWQVPDFFAAGWHESSARLGEIGNTVLNGHHNVYGEVFRYLVDLEIGDLVQVASIDHVYTYIITNKMILPERYQQLDVRMNNAQWILPSEDERLTLITCWPYESNTHRLIIVAQPIAREELFRDYE